MKLSTWNKTDYSIIFAENVFSFLCFVLFVCSLVINYTIQQWCSTAFALKCTWRKNIDVGVAEDIFPLLLLHNMKVISHQWDKVTHKGSYNNHVYPNWLTITSCIAQELNPGQLLVSQQHLHGIEASVKMIEKNCKGIQWSLMQTNSCLPLYINTTT